MTFQDPRIVALVALAIVATWILRSSWLKGMLGEARVNSSLRRRLDEREYRLLKDLTLPTRDGTTQIDHVVISRFGIFVIETKNMAGWIFGNADRAHWTQVIFRKKSKFQNPIRQNYKHVKTIQDLLGIDAHQFHNVIVFVGSAIPKTSMPVGVVWGAKSLVEYIRSKRFTLIEEQDLDKLAEQLSEARMRPGIQTHRAHVQHVRKKVASRKHDASKCPRCGAEMVERTNRKSGDRFLACSRFPKCRGTRTLP